MNTEYPIIIIGGGAVGSACAYYLSQWKKPALLIEQFSLGHDRGSSHGAARITRHSYISTRYASLMPEAYRAWKALEDDAGEKIFLETGGLTVAPAHELDAIEQNLNSLSVAYERLDASAARARFPQFSLPPGTEGLYEPAAGALHAARILEVERRLTLKNGSVAVRENTPVERLDLEGEKPVVVTGAGRFVCDQLIVTAGAWTGKLLPSLGKHLVPTRQQVLYFKTPDERFLPEQMPVFIVHHDGVSYYGMPALFGRGVKAAIHHGPVVDPDAVSSGMEADYESKVRSFLSMYLPTLAGAPLEKHETCLYTTAAKDEFVLGRLPAHPKVLVGSPCSGHGFKLSILTGRCLAETAAGRTRSVAEDFWSVPA